MVRHVASLVQDGATLMAMTLVCRAWRAAARSDAVWKGLFMRLYDTQGRRRRPTCQMYRNSHPARAEMIEGDRRELVASADRGWQDGEWRRRYQHLARFCSLRSMIFVAEPHTPTTSNPLPLSDYPITTGRRYCLHVLPLACVGPNGEFARELAGPRADDPSKCIGAVAHGKLVDGEGGHATTIVLFRSPTSRSSKWLSSTRF